VEDWFNGEGAAQAFRASLTNVLKHSAEVLCVAYAPDGTKLAAGAWDGTIKAWETEAGSKTCFMGWILRHFASRFPYPIRLSRSQAPGKGNPRASCRWPPPAHFSSFPRTDFFAVKLSENDSRKSFSTQVEIAYQ
jgi:hypothetical protein